MIRLFINHPLSCNAKCSLDDKASHYLVHVMRCKIGDAVLCFNGQDGEWQAELEISGKKQTSLVVKKQTRPQQNQPFCALCPALIKKDNIDLVLQKATELGVTDIYPLITDHTVHPHFNLAHANLIVQEAAEQCERLTLPTIHSPVKLNEISKILPDDCLYCYLSERKNTTMSLPLDGKIAFFVGPEGGWSKKELLFFNKHQFLPIHFDVGILRAETASIAILSCWQIGRKLYMKK